METTEFMLQLARTLVAERKVAESTANAYVKVLYAMNDKKPFKNLTFLKSTDTILERLAKYAESTQRSVLAAIVSVLSAHKDKATFKKPYTFYYDEMMKRSKVAREEDDKNEKTEKQKTNWITWAEVETKRNELLDAVNKFMNNAKVTPQEYEQLMMLEVLSLYTEISPRRNADFLNMFIVKKWTEAMDKEKNYMDMATKQFIFNKYKTAKKYGTQIEPIPERLWDRMAVLLKFHPLWKGHAKRKLEPVKLLVAADGTPLVADNTITRILNKVFGKKIGSSMLRHIYLSSKYGNTLEEMKKDSISMAHSLSMQKSYVKNDTKEEQKGSGQPTLTITEEESEED